MTFKFNVGDVVINFEGLQFWDNVYHYKLATNSFKKYVVASANEQYFTINSDIDLTRFSGLSECREREVVCYQNNGRTVDGHKFAFVNFTLREKDIRTHLAKLHQGVLDKCSKEDGALITKLEAEIRHKQEQIKQILVGKRPISFKTDVVERDFYNERMNELLSALD